jgi:hypothetical protein
MPDVCVAGEFGNSNAVSISTVGIAGKMGYIVFHERVWI